MTPKVLIVGNPETVHVGHHLLWAAQQTGLDASLMDIRNAAEAPVILRQINWRFRGHRPTRLDRFSDELLVRCQRELPDCVIVTGISPPTARTVREITRLGIHCVNYLTDDPWNPAHRARWFFDALPHYTCVFSPRESNLEDLKRLGCAVEYLPFAYSPEIHFPEAPPAERRDEFTCDVLFYGGADRDRVPYIEALIEEGLNVHLYGGYWERYSHLRPFARGIAPPQIVRWAVSGAKVTLCLVRRANRDGHAMRTFEVPAMGGCMLVEDTEEHCEILGREFEDTGFFTSIAELVEKTLNLIKEDKLREDIRLATHMAITSGGQTYAARLQHLLTMRLETLSR